MINSIKFLAVIGVSGWMLFGSHTASAQIPVTDLAQNSQTMAHNLATVAQWAKDIAEMKAQFDMLSNQYDQMQKDYEAVTGSRGLGNIMANEAFRDYLPNDWQTVYDSVKSGGYSGLSGTGQAVYNENKIFDGCAHIANDEQRIACEAWAVKGAQDKGFALDAYETAKNRITQIDQLMAQINETQDPKAIAELQGRIAAEQANIQNEQTKLTLYAMVAEAEEKLQVQRDHELTMKDDAKRGTLNIKPMTFKLGN
ncbi:P-type DNA transfer protein VirB5 [Yersinia enterocolitica]|nr:P-type DNA transfer protein VirB5 [Yersinia enterocolitica]